MNSLLRSSLSLGLLSLFSGCCVGGCGLLIGIEEAELTESDDEEDEAPGVGLSFAADSCNKELELDEDLIRGCLMRISCDPVLPPFNVSLCVSYARQLSSEKEQCGYKSASCEDIDDCLGRESADDDELALCDAGSVWVCDEDEAIRCDDEPYKIDCEQLGATCLDHSNEDYAHVVGCTPPSNPDCIDVNEGDWLCDGNNLYTCVDGQVQGWDCGATSSLCVEEVPGEAYCSEFTDECSDAGAASCSDGALEICSEEGYSVVFDCAVSDLDCVSSGSNPDCLADGCSGYSDCEEGCLADLVTMQFCIGGATVNLDCSEFGFDRCFEGELADGSEFASCAD